MTLPADYVQEHVRLGYAATTFGHQGDTVDVGLAVVTEATSHRGLYVAATRARDENRLLVVTDDPENVRDILERVLTNDRADIPAVVQRRNLAQQIPSGSGDQAGDDAVSIARAALASAQARAKPFVRPLDDATANLHAAEVAWHAAVAAHAKAPRRLGHRRAKDVATATAAVEEARQFRDAAEQAAAPYVAEVDARENDLQRAEAASTAARLTERLDRLTVEDPTRLVDRGIGALGI